MLVAVGSTLGGYGWGFLRGDAHGVALERERVRSLRAEPAAVEDTLIGVLAIPDARARLEAVMEFVDNHIPGDANALDAKFRDAITYVDPASSAVVIEWWARFDPAGALRSLNSRFFDAHRTPLVSMVIRQWARADPEAARQAVDAVIALSAADDHAGDTFRTALTWGWLQSGREGYWEYVEALPSGMTRQRSLSAVATWMVLNKGVEATLAFAETLDPGGRHSLKLQFHRRAAAAVARRDPRRAADWALEMFDSPFGEGMLTHVAGEWGRVDGPAALEWMLDLPPGKRSEDALHQAYLRWLRAELGPSRRWLEEKVPGPPLLGGAIALYIRSMGIQDPEAAAEFLQYLAHDETYRDRTTVFLMQRWLSVDRERALEWMDEADLDPALRAEVFDKPEPAPAQASAPGA